jgi:indolepyruvate ferredoxin oxidoreductase beta subunit
MADSKETTRNRIGIAILALGGQGGGVLADWIQEMARHNGWLAQGTSVPGVAQRTGSTVYYVELAPAGERLPIMAQMPTPGDVDIVIASELMEVGRAMLRNFSTADRTTLIGSTHRIYAISEKSGMGDSRGSSEQIIEATARRAKRFVGFDMEAATDRSGSVISAIMFGALGGSGALPFPREAFEQAIRDSGIAVGSNLRGFDEGFRAAQAPVALPDEVQHDVPQPTTEAGRRLYARILGEVPEAAHVHALHGVQRLMDYQDAAYAGLYLDRLAEVARLDTAPWEITSEVARHLALWMSYEDTIRVADLKVRASRFDRVRSEAKAGDAQLLGITEFMHPRLQEVCETLPAGLGRWILHSPRLCKMLEPFFRDGRYVETTSLRWFLVLRFLSAMRPMRPRSLRYVEEQERIDGWLADVRGSIVADPALALALARSQRLIKGYGDTFERGLRNFRAIRSALFARAAADRRADWLEQACAQALADDSGKALERALAA